MTHGPLRSAIALFVALLGALGAVVPVAYAQTDDAPESSLSRRDAVPVVESVDGHHDVVAPPLHRPARSLSIGERRFGRSIGSVTGPAVGRRIDGTMTTTYERPTPPEVREVIDSAVAVWDSALRLSPDAPVEISVLWTDLGARLLGQAGTEGEYRDAEQFPTDRWYPAALANQLAGMDVNGADTPEVLIELNSGLGDDWYISTGGRPGRNQIDLFSVVLHEIAHGLGFLGSATAARDGTVRLDHSPPSIYDDFVLNADGQRLVDLDPTDALAALTSGSLNIDIGFGRHMPLSAPDRFVNGSSYSHFDESIPDDDPGAMMTPALKNREVQRALDATVLGVLDQIGWSLATRLLAPVIVEVEAASGEVELVWSEDWSTPGAFASAYQIIAEPTGAEPGAPAQRQVVEAAMTNSLRLRGLMNGTSYRLDVRGTRADHLATAPTSDKVQMPANPNRVKSLVAQGSPGVRLTWSSPEPSGEQVTGYELEVRAAASSEWQPLGNASSGWSGDLDDGRYWFRVRAVNAAGNGNWSETPMIGVAPGPTRPMPLDGQIARLYEAYFLRPADAEGMGYWRRVRATGSLIDVVSDSFAGSEEFLQTYGELSDRQFVDRLYRNVLDRAPDAEGYDYWLEILDGGASRGAVVLRFSESPEFIRQTGTTPPQSAAAGVVERLHLAMLRRAPNRAETVELLGTQLSSSRVARRLLGSAELSNLWEATSDAELLGMIAESTGASGGTAASVQTRLADGADLVDLVVELAQSPDFIVSTGTGV